MFGLCTPVSSLQGMANWEALGEWVPFAVGELALSR